MSNYKYSGYDWIGDVPTSWDIKRIKNCYQIKKSKAKQDNPVILSLARDSIKVRDISDNFGQLAESYYDYNPVAPGDFLMNPMDLYSGANCNVSEVEGVISPAYINLRADSNNNPYFLDYFMKTQYWGMALFAHGKGISYDNRWTLNPQTLLNYPFPCPPIDTQNKIVKELRKKCSNIDSIIEIVNEEIERLKELKKSIVEEAVSKKDGWEQTKLLYLLSMKITDGPHETPELIDNGIPFISAEAVYSGEIDFEHKRGDISQEYYEECCKKYVPQLNDIYMVKSGGTTGNLAIVKTREIFTIWSPLAAIRVNPEIAYYKFIYYVLFSPSFQNQVALNWSYGTQQNIGMRTLERLSIDYPPLEEQIRIANLLDKKCDKIDELIKLKNERIELLNERKKVLIFNYVTGKREVC